MHNLKDIEEMKIILKAISLLEKQEPESRHIIDTLSYLNRVSNLNMCLVKLCWKMFGDREEDIQNRLYGNFLLEKR